MNKKAHGFTIVELLITIVVIAILASISIVAYNNIQSRARDTIRQNDIRQVHKFIEVYYAQEGHYPVTTTSLVTHSSTMARTDANCHFGSRQADWVPDLANLTPRLPQSTPNTGKGARLGGVPAQQEYHGRGGCYLYASDGQQYILSAWNNIESGPQTAVMYRRLGFREPWNGSANRYYCNHPSIGGAHDVYSETLDMYKYSYTVSNITTCDETPPPGA